MAHVTSGVCRLVFETVTLHPPLPVARPMVPSVLPVVTQKFTEPAVGGVVHATEALYLTESAKYASSAVTRFRRSDFIEATYAFALVLANFGIAIAARMPMITTTINSSMSVNPLRFMLTLLPLESISDNLRLYKSGLSPGKWRQTPSPPYPHQRNRVQAHWFNTGMP